MKAPRITASQATLVLSRNATDMDLPEAKLWLAVIDRAAQDIERAMFPPESDDEVFLADIRDHGRTAKEFVNSGRFDVVCDRIGLGADMAREVIARIGEQIGKLRHKKSPELSLTA
jgi:hypothetical protein